MKFKILQKNEQGQSLIEVLVVGVVSAIMILSLIMIILNSLKNAQFAQNQTQATKLAQDTIDKIRTLRDSNNYGTLTSNPAPVSTCFIGLWNNTSGDFYCGGTSSFCFYKLANTSMELKASSSEPLSPANSLLAIENLSNGFTRQIKVSQPSLPADPVPANYVNLMVTITWNDSSGSHSSQLETILTRPNYDCK